MAVTESQVPNQQGGVVTPDDGDSSPVPYVSWNVEQGRTGLRRAAGYVDDEFLPALRGRKAVAVFREMGDNDPIAGALLFALQRLISEVSWRVEPASSKAEDRKNAEFLEQCMNDMTQSWSEFILEALSCLQYGFSWHEMVFKKRMGPWYRSEKNQDLHKSKYDDGRIGWARLPIRSQESLLRWIFYPSGDVKAMIQMPAPTYELITLPRTKSLLFRPSAPRNNPEGFSVLRRAYRAWYMKKRIEEYEAVGVERDLAGLPMGKIPSKILGAKPGTKEFELLQAWKKLVRNIRRDEQDGVLVPSDMNAMTGKPEYEFSLLTSGGSRQFDTNAIIERYATWMLMQVLADFIYVGHQSAGTGTYNMHTDKSGLFKTACNSFAQAIADELNRQAVPELFRVNGVKPMELPKLVPSQVDAPDLAQLGAFLVQTAGLGVQWFPDPKLEEFMRQAADLPAMDKDQERLVEQQMRQQRIITSATQRLQALQIGQQAQQGELQLQQQQMANTQQAIGTATQASELQKPGSTQPPPPPGRAAGATRPPAKKTGAKVATRSKPAAKQKAGTK